ncbi:NAD-dependent epimerase/dehydratase family protein [Bacillus sp. ISL-39]|uniref:NAD-dependent epimerase/dehydratase family protein n=1 Tax=Bacillus sp. ISL-39 TaxID=2819124 RepID=UPI001BEA4E30|nr:NAD-dependent epimerase/dehydratase family protein [Bacillus sp. ISL-39]MBT2639682.1 NAD-dependent epimerase/dehydratase family protein [Bacillus sp. ISL-39]
MKSLITGGAGFIGRHLIEKLIKEKHEIIVIDNMSSAEEREFPENARFYKRNIEDESIGEIFEKEKPDYVFHLAAQVSVQKSMNDPYRDCLSNIAGTVNLLRFSSKYKVKKYIFASSAAVYGEPEYLPIDEQHRKQSLSFYSLSKNTAEEYIRLFNKAFPLNFVILRFANVYGPGQNANGEAGVISIFMDQLSKGLTPVVFGGNQTRDFVYVKDVADAMHAVLETQESGTFNVSTNTETSIIELLELIQKCMRRKTETLTEPPRPGDIKNSRLDNSMIKEVIKWTPKVTLNEGIKYTLEDITETGTS